MYVHIGTDSIPLTGNDKTAAKSTSAESAKPMGASSKSSSDDSDGGGGRYYSGTIACAVVVHVEWWVKYFVRSGCPCTSDIVLDTNPIWCMHIRFVHRHVYHVITQGKCCTR